MSLRQALLRQTQLVACPAARISLRGLSTAGFDAHSPPERPARPGGGWLSSNTTAYESQLERGNWSSTNQQEPWHEPLPVDDDRPFKVQDDYEHFQRFRARSGKLGADVGWHYQPHRFVNTPPSPRHITLELLLASGAHLGHATSLWNPGNQRYILGVRAGIHIIALETTAALLRRACTIVQGVTHAGGLVLFVGSRPGHDRCVVEAAHASGGCHLFTKWVPGTITNGRRIVGHGAVVEKDMADRLTVTTNPDAKPWSRSRDESGEGGIDNGAPLRPALVVCLNPLENYILLHECGLYGIPTVGIIDTDADPTWVTYPIPANDDSLRCVQLVAGVLGKAGEAGRLARIRTVEREEDRRRQSAQAQAMY